MQCRSRGCPFYGSRATNYLCSSCFTKSQKKGKKKIKKPPQLLPMEVSEEFWKVIIQNVDDLGVLFVLDECNKMMHGEVSKRLDSISNQLGEFNQVIKEMKPTPKKFKK